MRVLMTSIGFAWRSGSEIVARDTAVGLARRGHAVTIFSNTLGVLADETRRDGVKIIDSLDQLEEPPDIIHAQHSLPTAEVFVRFPGVPAVWTCHDSVAWHDEPPLFPQIRRYIAVDEACRDRILQAGVPIDRVVMLHNAIDLRRIPQRPAAPPPAPRRAAAFGKAAVERVLIKEACDAAGLSFAIIGGEAGTATPEAELVRADIVFATARAAIEAMACGCAVVLIDSRGFGGLVTTDRYEEWRDQNFGLRALTRPNTSMALEAALRAYDAREVRAVTAMIRRDADIERRLDRIETMHAHILTKGFDSASHEAGRAAALQTVLRQLTPHHRPQGPHWPWARERAGLMAQIAALEARLAHPPGERTPLQSPAGPDAMVRIVGALRSWAGMSEAKRRKPGSDAALY